MLESDRRLTLTDSFLDKYRQLTPTWGFNGLGAIVFKRTYSRTTEDGRLEEWWETVRRVVEGVYWAQIRHCEINNLPFSFSKAQRSAQHMYDLIYSMKFLPPGRGLEHMGAKHIALRGGAPLNNCGLVTTKDIKSDFSEPFCTLMDYSMLGVGMGGDVRGAGAITIKEPTINNEAWIVEDSREGWVESLRVILDAFVGKAQLPERFDYSQLRPAGSPLKTFGGISSGSGPLEELHARAMNILRGRVGNAVTSTDIVDIFNIIAKCVVAGGIRRSAEIMFGDPNDAEFLQLKNAELYPEEVRSHRWASNNSLLAYPGIDYEPFVKSIAKYGEPGFFWIENARRHGRMKDPEGDWDVGVTGTNPCVPGDTEILTKEGYIPIRDLVGHPIEVWNGIQWSEVTPRITGHNQPITRVTLSDGTSLRCTPKHQWILEDKQRIAAFKLQPGMRLAKFDMPIVTAGQPIASAYCQGFYTGDGQGNEDDSSKGALIYDHSKSLLPLFSKLGCTIGKRNEKYKRIWVGMNHLKLKSKYFVPHNGDLSSRLLWLAGLIDSDGNLMQNPNSTALCINNTNLELLINIRRMLTTMGVRAKVTKSTDAGMRQLPNGKGGKQPYFCKTEYRLLINATDTATLFRLGLTLHHEGHQSIKLVPQRDARRYVAVVSVEPDGVENIVYCLTENKNHSCTFDGIVTGQCGEQGLEPNELCTLVEVFPARHNSLEELHHTFKFAYLYAKSVTLIPTHNPRTNAVMGRNRRIGTSMSGITQAIAKFGFRQFINACDDGYKYIRELDRMYSRWLCIPTSIKVTSIKPSGTISLLAGATPGIHFPHSQFYVRNVRFDKLSKLLPIIKKAGYKIEHTKNGDNTMVVSFPVQEKLFTKSKSQASIWEQLELAAQMQYWWADNQVSVTVTFKQEEVSDLARALSYYESRLKGVALLPEAHGYDQAPYQEITESEYKKMTSKLKPMDFSSLTEKETTEKFCDGETCELKTNAA